jgi:hypothetical protein
MCYCDDYYPPTVFREKNVKARKPHKCSECYRVITVGETYRSVFGVWEGNAQTFHWCAHCDAAQTVVAAVTDCRCYSFGGLWDDFHETAENFKELQRIYYAVRRKWTYRRGPQKGQLMPIPNVPVTA